MTRPDGRGRFIAFEGGEGTGKSTQARLLAERLGARLTREPGGTQLGEQLRSLLLDPANVGLDPRAEALLMAAARAQHIAEVIEPTLAAGTDLVTDRYIGSSLAYQGVARGLGVDAVASLSRFASDDLWPDLTILLVAPAEVTAARLEATGATPDRLEALGDDFHGRVVEGFLALAQGLDDWVIVDATGPVGDVAERVWGVAAAGLGGGRR